MKRGPKTKKFYDLITSASYARGIVSNQSGEQSVDGEDDPLHR